MKIFKKFNLTVLFLVIGLSCFSQPIYAETRTILSGGKVKITDGTNTATLNSQGHIKATQDTQSLVLNRYVAKFHEHDTTLSVAANAGDTAISIQASDYADFDIGDRLFLNFGILEENNYPVITAKPGSPILTLNKPLDKAYPIGSEVQHIVIDGSSEVGTLANPISYKIKPPPGITYNIMGAVAVIQMGSAGDYGKFGNIAAPGLTNGVIARASIGGSINTRTVLRTNLDIEDDTTEPLIFHDRAGGGGDFGLIAEWIFKKFGAYIPLNGDTEDFFEILIQDDISSLDVIRVKFHGYVTINP